MPGQSRHTASVALILSFILTGCGNSNGSIGSLGNLFGGGGGGPRVAAAEDSLPANATAGTPPPVRVIAPQQRTGLFGQRIVDPTTTIQVNKYIWAAALDVLSFLPVQSADPFTGVIVTGFGTPPGGGRAYRATILIQDPALDARSLNVALYSRSGAVAPATVRAVEDAILARARQLRSGGNAL